MIEEISGTGGISSGEESDSEDLYTESAQSLPGSLYIPGELVSTPSVNSLTLYTNNSSFYKLLAGCLPSLRQMILEMLISRRGLMMNLLLT